MTALESKILASSPYASFQAERSIAELLARTKWESTHGLYYDDLLTNKQRELDVVARQIWRRKHRDTQQLCRITVLVEVKSMSGFHLLLSEHPAASRDFYRHTHWLGDPSGKYIDLLQQFDNLGIEPKKIGALIEKLHRYAYPRQHARMWAMMVRPHSIPVFTSFRETNLGSEKDLDNSVFWRASQGLRSAHASIASNIRRTHLETIAGAAEFEAKSKNWVDSMFWWASQQIGMVDIIHPVVVTDAKLWAASNGGAEERKYARFGSHTYTGEMDWWCDLVNTEHLQEYVTKLTDHYRRYLRSAKAKLGG